MAPSACKADQNRAEMAVSECVGQTRAVTITVPGEIEFRGPVLSAVVGICEIACPDKTVGAEFTHELVSAVGEGFNNAVIHSYEHIRGTVCLSLSFDSQRFVVELTEDGAAFDPNSVQLFSGDDLRESGFGLFIIKSFVDEMSYTAGPPNRLRLIKSLPKS